MMKIIKQIVNLNRQVKTECPLLKQNVLSVNNIKEIMKAMNWTNNPILDRADIYDFDYLEDLNERRIRDAEVLGTVMKNSNSKVALEIGTANGMGTLLMSVNASSDCVIYTVNIPPEEIASGAGGVLTTIAIERENIGIEYKKRGLTNIHQIFANTATWNPDIGNIDVAFIDGCHDAEFVYNDTKKILNHMPPGGFILWHDFNLDLKDKYGWINDVCQGVERLCRDGFIKGKILHLKDSWIGLYRVI